MERESFESEAIAKLMNDNFVNIKVDKEERSDVDRVYMTYVQVSVNGGFTLGLTRRCSMQCMAFSRRVRA